MKEMYVEKFLQQVHRKLNEQGITNSKLRDTCIDIYEGENEIFKIDREGGMFYASDNRFRNVVDELPKKEMVLKLKYHPTGETLKKRVLQAERMRNARQLKKNSQNN